MGKTQLALRLISDVGGAYPDGQLYLELKGTSESPVSARTAVSYAIGKLAPASALPADLEELIKLWRSKLYGKRLILCMDDALDADQIAMQVAAAEVLPISGDIAFAG